MLCAANAARAQSEGPLANGNRQQDTRVSESVQSITFESPVSSTAILTDNEQVHAATALHDQLLSDVAACARATLGSASAQLVASITQIRTVPSLLPAARDLPSGLKATASTRQNQPLSLVRPSNMPSWNSKYQFAVEAKVFRNCPESRLRVITGFVNSQGLANCLPEETISGPIERLQPLITQTM